MQLEAVSLCGVVSVLSVVVVVLAGVANVNSRSAVYNRACGEPAATRAAVSK